MIIDDKISLIGSANINDSKFYIIYFKNNYFCNILKGSMNGTRDSEIAVKILISILFYIYFKLKLGYNRRLT